MKTRLHCSVQSHGLLAAAVALAGLVTADPMCAQQVPVRLSFKFILNASGNRPATGNINTDAEINAQIDRGNAIFSRFISEFRLQNVEIVDVAGISQWYNADASNADRDNLRAAAQAAPATYHWRTDAVNVYISASGATGISDFTPNNNIILVGQGSWDTTVAHEAGHILNLLHTHETCCYANYDGCDDTLPDDSSWSSHDQMAMFSYGVVYTSLNAAQKALVDMTWGNLMSYHDPNNRSMLSSCQMDRQSTEAYNDRNWILSRIPVYVDAGYGGTHSGSFTQPYQTVQQAISAGGLNGNVMVLETGTYAHPAGTVGTRTDAIARKGTCTIHDAPPTYSLPYRVEESTNAAVRKAVVLAQEADRRGDLAGVISNLQAAELHAVGREQTVIQLELAQRFRDSGRTNEAALYFKNVSLGTDQLELKTVALDKLNQLANPATTKPAAQEHLLKK